MKITQIISLNFCFLHMYGMDVEQPTPAERMMNIICYTSSESNDTTTLQIQEAVLMQYDAIKHYPIQENTFSFIDLNWASKQKPTQEYINKLLAPLKVMHQNKSMTLLINATQNWTNDDLVNVFIDYVAFLNPPDEIRTAVAFCAFRNGLFTQDRTIHPLEICPLLEKYVIDQNINYMRQDLINVKKVKDNIIIKEKNNFFGQPQREFILKNCNLCTLDDLGENLPENCNQQNITSVDLSDNLILNPQLAYLRQLFPNLTCIKMHNCYITTVSGDDCDALKYKNKKDKRVGRENPITFEIPNNHLKPETQQQLNRAAAITWSKEMQLIAWRVGVCTVCLGIGYWWIKRDYNRIINRCHDMQSLGLRVLSLKDDFFLKKCVGILFAMVWLRYKLLYLKTCLLFSKEAIIFLGTQVYHTVRSPWFIPVAHVSY